MVLENECICSLCGIDLGVEEYNDGIICNICIEEQYISKQKVKEAIEQVFNEGPRSWRAVKRKIKLEKLLGLGDEE